jgi:serine/threonine protein kinase
LSRGPLSLPQGILLITRIAEALSVSHQRGVIHRGLSF